MGIAWAPGLALASIFSVAAAPAWASPLVAVDVGHTLAAPGAQSARGRSEFAFNRELAQHLARALEARGLRVRLVNADGHIASLQARPQAALGADLFVSIHHDSVSAEELESWWPGAAEQHYSDRWAGHSLFVSRKNPDLPRSLLCARTVGARLQRMGFLPTAKNGRSREWADRQLAVHFYDNLVVLYRTTLPALLFEAGVIRNRDEELLLRDPRRQAMMADGIATGIAACLSVEPLRP